MTMVVGMVTIGGRPLPVAAGADANIGRRDRMAEADFTSYYDFR